MQNSYEHVMEWIESAKERKNRQLTLTAYFLGIILFGVLLLKEKFTFTIVFGPTVLFSFMIFHTDEAKFTIALNGQDLKISYFVHHGYMRVGTFSHKIVDAYITSTETPVVQRFISRKWYHLPRIASRLWCSPYIYAFFLRDRHPLSEGHQVLDVTLANGKHVLIETDDADNFLAALRKAAETAA